MSRRCDSCGQPRPTGTWATVWTEAGRVLVGLAHTTAAGDVFVRTSHRQGRYAVVPAADVLLVVPVQDAELEL